MNKDFEFKQLLQAYRRGVISESTFELELAGIDGGSTAGATADGGFRAFGKTYASERDAILEFLDKYGAGEAAAEIPLNKWADVSKTDCVRGGVRMIAEREGFHGRVFAQRLRELGGVKKDDGSEVTRLLDYLTDPNLPDGEKLLRATAGAPDPKARLQPIFDFGEAIKDDLRTKEMVRLYALDELNSGQWTRAMCEAINGKSSGAVA